MKYANRILGSGVMTASEFLANPDNWRFHSREQQQALDGVLEQVGWVQDVVVNLRTSPAWGDKQGVETLVDGHLRVTLALRQGDDTPVPYKYVDLMPDEEALVLATLDPLAALALADRPKLETLMRQIQTADAAGSLLHQPALQEMLAKMAEQYALFQGDDLDLSGFASQKLAQTFFRVVVDGLDREKAENLAAGLDGAKVEQYKK